MRRQITELLVDVHVDGATVGNNMLQASSQDTSISHSPIRDTIFRHWGLEIWLLS